MKKVVCFLFLFASYFTQAQTAGYNISVTIKPFKNQYIYLGYYYGKVKALADSALSNSQGVAVFKGAKQLTGGIYFVVSPGKERILFELLLDKQQQFAIVADTSNLPASVNYINSADNKLFQNYSRFATENGQQVSRLAAILPTANPNDTAIINTEIRSLNKKMQQYRDSVTQSNPGSMLAALLQSLKEPIVPSADKHPGGKYDSTFAYNYFKNHYWDGVKFTDERMIRTPIFEQKLDKYYKELVIPDPDSLQKEADAMLTKAKPNKEMFKYLLTYFVQKYINPEYMGQDAVFVHLFEKYINNNAQVDWFTEKYKKYMSDRAYSIMGNLIGYTAQNLNLVDTAGTPTPLYKVNAAYTVIIFWDATCGHCKEVVPKIDSLFQTKWKQQGVAIYGVMTDGGKAAWLQYIQQNNLKDWMHVYQTEAQRDAETNAGKPNYRQLFDVYQTPVLYLLDANKKILAKKLTWEQINDLLAAKVKAATGK